MNGAQEDADETDMSLERVVDGTDMSVENAQFDFEEQDSDDEEVDPSM
jgi:hypothetical protein